MVYQFMLLLLVMLVSFALHQIHGFLLACLLASLPMPMDEEHARKTDFKHRICYGMLIVSFFSIDRYASARRAWTLTIIFSETPFTMVSEPRDRYRG